ncbi:hypothetical protein MXB_3452 [Myxobolus squamalis]|nr:hypothetical protein MXB_3452 [Myxobolus squamalis]
MVFSSFDTLPFSSTLNYINRKHKIDTVVEINLEKRPIINELDVANLIAPQSMFVGYPFSRSCYVKKFFDFKKRFILVRDSDKKSNSYVLQKEDLSDTEIENLILVAEAYRKNYKLNFGINIPTINHILLNIKNNGLCRIERSWSDEFHYVPLDLCHTSLSAITHIKRVHDVKNIFCKGDLVICTSPEFYGSIAKIVSVNPTELSVKLQIYEDPTANFNECNFLKEEYPQKFSVASAVLSVSKTAIIIDCTFFIMSSFSGMFKEVDIGLQIKRTSCRMETLGYTKYVAGQYFYSLSAIALVRDYLTRFPQLIELFNSFTQAQNNIDKSRFDNFCEKCTSGCHFVDNQSVRELENVSVEKVKCTDIVILKPKIADHSLKTIYNPCNYICDEFYGIKFTHNLLDIVICTKIDSSCPFMQFGIVIGTFQTRTNNSLIPCNKVEVLFFKKFSKGKSYRGEYSRRCACVSSSWLMNITQGRSSVKSLIPQNWKNVLTSGVFEQAKPPLSGYNITLKPKITM